MRVVRLARLPLLAGLALFAAVLAGCSGAGEHEKEPTEDGLRAAADEQARAMFAGDEEAAYEFFSEACQEKLSLREFRTELDIARKFFTGFTGVDLEDVEVSSVTVRDFSPERAEVLVEVTTPPESAIPLGDDEWQEWAWEEGGWRLTVCNSAMSEGG